MSPGPKPNFYPSSLDDFTNAADHVLDQDRREAAARAATSAPAAQPLSEPSARDISVTISVRLRQ